MINEVSGRKVNAEVWMILSPAEQENIRHNLWRYHELQRLRQGQPNHYLDTSYR